MRPCSHDSDHDRPAVLVLAAIFTVLTAVPALAAWQPDGVPLHPAAAPNESYFLQGLVPDGAQGAIALWWYSAPTPDFSGTNFAIAAQRVDLAGNRPAPWPASGTSLLTWFGPSGSGISNASVVGFFPDGAGGGMMHTNTQSFVVELLHLFQSRDIGTSAITSGVPGFSGSSSGYPILDVACDGDGAGGVFEIGREQTFAPPPGPPPPGELVAHYVSATGTEHWPALVIAPAVNLGPPGLAALADGTGGAYFAWIDVRDAGDPDLYVQHVDASGAIPQDWPANGLLVCDAAGTPGVPKLAADGTGGAFIAWQDTRTGVTRVYVQHVRSDASFEPGIPADGREIPLSGIGDAFVRVDADGFGGCFLVREWVTSGGVAISALHRLDPAALPRPGWPAEGVPLNTLSPGVGAVGLAADGAGGAFVSWRNGFGSLAPQGLYANHFDAMGAPAPGWTSAGYRLSGTGQESMIVRSGTGAIVAWDDSRFGGAGVYAQRLVQDGPVPTTLALVSAVVGAEGVTLDWYAADANGLAATIERRGVSDGWSAIGTALGDATGHLRYVDANATPGSRVAYRASWSEDGVTRHTAEAWVDVPAAARLALSAPRPNPSTGPVSFSIALEGDGPAALDVVDLAGRRVSHRSLDRLGPGTHIVKIEDSENWSPGLYVVRLVQGDVMRTVRLVRAP